MNNIVTSPQVFSMKDPKMNQTSKVVQGNKFYSSKVNQKPSGKFKYSTKTLVESLFPLTAVLICNMFHFFHLPQNRVEASVPVSMVSVSFAFGVLDESPGSFGNTRGL